MTPIPVPAPDLPLWADRIAWHVEAFCANGQWEPDDILRMIAERERQLWVVEDAGKVVCALLTSVLADRLKTVLVTHCAGERYREWLHLWPIIEGWAREIGAGRVEIIARPGWERPLRGLGMKKTHVVMEARL